MQDTIDTLNYNFQKFRDSFGRLWHSSPYFRGVSMATTSICGYLTMRYIYFRIKRRIYNMPPGPIGIPGIGIALNILKREYLKELATTYGCIVSTLLGPNHLILINEPKLARKWFSNPRSLYTALPENPTTFFSMNGKEWADRRRIIFANLMSTMKASYVETVTKKFIKTKLFPIFDSDIKNNKSTNIKPLFRPIGFNIVLQACFGKELSSLNDAFWTEWNQRALQDQKKTNLRFMIWNMFGSNKLGLYLQRKLTGDDFQSFIELNKQIDSLNDFAINKEKEIILDDEMRSNDDIKLFNEYVNDYVNNTDGAKYTKRHLLGDMAFMIHAATDTTYSCLAFSLLLAAKYPDIQEKIYQELINAFGHNVDNIELRNNGIFKIPKLRAFVHESLRIYPPIYLAGFRRLKEDGVILNGWNIPKNSLTMINVVAIGQNPKYWIKNYDIKKDGKINMNDIHLDFWMVENGNFSKKKNSASFFPFHFGKRDCAGQSLAMKEIIIVLAMIFMKYKIERYDEKTGFEIKPMFGGAFMEPTVKNIRFKIRN